MRSIAAALVLGFALSAAAAAASWLDAATPANWNHGGPLPKAGSRDPLLAAGGRCHGTARPPEMPEDRALSAAGWSLFGPYERFAGTVVVMGMSGADGMCRPLHFQGFVFRNGRFAGTLAPAPMDARTDGALQSSELYGGTTFSAVFVRYRPQDPLCCPSATNDVSYRIDQRGTGPLLVPVSSDRSPA
jgi:hypothetical protein